MQKVVLQNELTENLRDTVRRWAIEMFEKKKKLLDAIADGNDIQAIKTIYEKEKPALTLLDVYTIEDIRNRIHWKEEAEKNATYLRFITAFDNKDKEYQIPEQVEQIIETLHKESLQIQRLGKFMYVQPAIRKIIDYCSAATRVIRTSGRKIQPKKTQVPLTDKDIEDAWKAMQKTPFDKNATLNINTSGAAFEFKRPMSGTPFIAKKQTMPTYTQGGANIPNIIPPFSARRVTPLKKIPNNIMSPFFAPGGTRGTPLKIPHIIPGVTPPNPRDIPSIRQMSPQAFSAIRRMSVLADPSTRRKMNNFFKQPQLQINNDTSLINKKRRSPSRD